MHLIEFLGKRVKLKTKEGQEIVGKVDCYTPYEEFEHGEEDGIDLLADEYPNRLINLAESEIESIEVIEEK